MELPFYVASTIPELRLFELADGRFQIIEIGPVEPIVADRIGPFLSGRGYLIVEENLAAYIDSIEIDRISLQPVVLYDPSSGNEFRTHVRVKVGQFFSADQINDLDLSGLKILTMNDEFYFVSPELKAMLEKQEFQYLQFTKGLTSFAGGFR